MYASVTGPVSFLVLGLCAAPLAGAASLDELERRCEQAREQQIAPLREQAIEDCVSAPRTTRSREDCERRYRDFGQGGGTVGGGVRPRMFNDLPECVEYFEARDGQSGGSRR